MCDHCKDKGYVLAHRLDGMTIYSWQKPVKVACAKCEKGRIHVERNRR